MLGEGSSNKIKPLSNDAVSRLIDEMAADVESKLIKFMRECKFALQIDDSTVIDNKAIVLAYVRFINENGAPTMSGRHTGLLAHLKKEVLMVITIHCVIHCQHFPAKNLSGALHDNLQFVISGINEIKADSLNDCLFRELCRENDEDFERLLLHTDVRWLSKGNCLRCFFESFDSVTEFLDTTDPVLSESLKQFKFETSYLTDIFEKMYEINVKLQGNKVNIIRTKEIMCSFIAKFDIYKSNIGRKELMQFPTPRKCLMADIEILENKIIIFTDHLDLLKTDMESRFKDLMKLEIPDWIFDLFSFEVVDKFTSSLQTEFLDLKYAKVDFKKYGYELA
ncbi:protein FAM200C-like [Parasteatoda tepidariorum]|uniref:protein FAM200C-like n=1 Tax=Parasteatoda tepidariorum TaxID=114398 RepID=UPI001C71B2C7|nr:SCAN domain-containing protein 3-like [Parasteatoda tepidariorum]